MVPHKTNLTYIGIYYVSTKDGTFTVCWCMFFFSLIGTFNEPSYFGRGNTPYYIRNFATGQSE